MADGTRLKELQEFQRKTELVLMDEKARDKQVRTSYIPDWIRSMRHKKVCKLLYFQMIPIPEEQKVPLASVYSKVERSFGPKVMLEKEWSGEDIGVMLLTMKPTTLDQAIVLSQKTREYGECILRKTNQHQKTNQGKPIFKPPNKGPPYKPSFKPSFRYREENPQPKRFLTEAEEPRTLPPERTIEKNTLNWYLMLFLGSSTLTGCLQLEPRAETAFNHLKEVMIRAPVLALPNFSKPFIVETDACGKGIGAVLMQEGRPIAYLSKALAAKNMGLSTYEKEFLALLLAVTKWKHYLQGNHFVIRTDPEEFKAHP
ncbi:Retrovirus-related Pol polyprotein from transposon [Sesamum angolense]|uniref:Retrovirus-related Pol polyprotein from transposon n=1 Tax=Sesamum angolense TaxID=2727404 RepID=A0AAE1WGL9_9LAMI|nr:Retrovirus-related Pol polyprotein from transposon [Sesamum angolense]